MRIFPSPSIQCYPSGLLVPWSDTAQCSLGQALRFKRAESPPLGLRVLGHKCGGGMGVTPCPGPASSVSIWGLHTAPGRMVPENKAGTSPGAAQKLRLLLHSF